MLFLYEVGRKVNILSEMSKFQSKSQMHSAKAKDFPQDVKDNLMNRGNETIYCERILGDIYIVRNNR